MKSPTTIMKQLLLFASILLLQPIWAQADLQSIPTHTPTANALVITGKVVEASSGQPIDYANVAVLNPADNSILTATTTTDGGLFELRVASPELIIEVSFIGYESVRLTDISFTGRKTDIGEIVLGENALKLDEVTVTADRSTTEFRLDKRVFNVGANLSSSGASALEVLNNVPSVNVSIEGQVTLRGSGGVQILINGKPSVLADDESGALGTITADMIESIEVVTNPSAKYEAEGSAGIINIVLKKSEKEGTNGSVTINGGIPANHSIGLSLNNRTKRINLFTQAGLGYRKQPTTVKNINRNTFTGNTILSNGEEFRNERFANLILGADYYITPQNILTLSGSVTYEVEEQPSETIFERLIEGEPVLATWRRNETTEATNPKVQYELQYKRDFTDHKDHQLLFSAIGNYFGKDQASVFRETLLFGEEDIADQLTETKFEEGKYTFNLDYTKPFAEEWTLEIGSQFVTNNVSNDYEVQDQIDNEFVINEGLTNIFDYQQQVLGVYGTGAYENAVWGLKLGLRMEHTNLSTELQNTNQKNEQIFTNIFPTVHTSYKLTERVSFQAGYSKRIYRPRLWDLNPFFNIRNNFTIRTGNPDLLPQFTDSYEVGSIFIYDKVSFNINAYFRYTTDVIERISTIEDNVNIFTPINLGTNQTIGLEANFKYAPIKKWSINGDLNWNSFRRDGQFNDQNFDFQAQQWSAKIINKVKLNRSFDFEVTGQYQSSVQTVQGTRAANLFANLGIRYKILDGKGVFNFSVRDVFASRIRETESVFNDFYAYAFRQRGRFITLGFSYGFGKGEAMNYSGGRRR